MLFKRFLRERYLKSTYGNIGTQLYHHSQIMNASRILQRLIHQTSLSWYFTVINCLISSYRIPLLHYKHYQRWPPRYSLEMSSKPLILLEPAFLTPSQLTVLMQECFRQDR